MKNEWREIMIEKVKEKYQGAKKSRYGDLIINHLLKRCEEDEGLAEDMMQQSKDFRGCITYITNLARKQAINGTAAIEDSVVYEWAEDYFRAYEPKKRTEHPKATTTPSNPIKDARDVKKPETNTEETVKPESKEEQKKEEAKPAEKETPKSKKKKKSKEVKGQMSIFDFIN